MKKTILIYGLLMLSVSLSSCGASLPPHIAAQFATPSPTPYLPGISQLSTTTDQQINHVVQQSSDNFDVIEGLDKDKNGNPWNPYLGPSLFSDVAIPAPFPLLKKSEDQINILILGTDQRPNDSGFRTDVIMLLSINTENGQANLISFPRDLYLYQPGYRMDRFNSALSRGGIELSYSTLEYNFGIQVDHYLIINFTGFGQIVDSLGGLKVNVAQSISDHRDGLGIFTVNAGNVEMDAETALWYVRSRGTSNDFDRNRRQQEIISALFFQAFSLDIFRNTTDLYQAYKNTIESDLGLNDLMSFLPLASQIYSGEIIGTFLIGPNETIPWITSSGAQVLLPNRENIQIVLNKALLENSE